jgi:actin-related protein
MENKRNLLESEVDLKDLIVIDNGTDSIKMGYSGENHPRIIIDSITGRINRVDDGD